MGSSNFGTVQQDIVFSLWHQKADTLEPEIREFFVFIGNIINCVPKYTVDIVLETFGHQPAEKRERFYSVDTQEYCRGG